MEHLTNLGLGLALSLVTAIGCISYEKLVKDHGFLVIVLLQALYVGTYLAFTWLRTPERGDIFHAFLNDRSSVCHAAIYVLSSVTIPLWYQLTLRTNVVTGSFFEIVYVPVLLVLYVFWGTTKLNPTFILGGLLVIFGVLIVDSSQRP